MSVQILDDFHVEQQADLKQKIGEIVSFARGLEVTNEQAFHQLTALYSESKQWEKHIELARKTANQPDQERISIRNDKAKELLKPLLEIQSIAKTKSAQWQALLEDRKRQEEEKVKKMIQLLEIEDMPYLAPVEKTCRTEKAVLYTRTVRKFRIVDQSKVPAKYLKVNEDQVELDIKLGIAEIPGLEIYEEQVTQLKTR